MGEDVNEDVRPALALEVAALIGGLLVHHGLVPAVLEDKPGRTTVAVAAYRRDGAARVEGDVDLVEWLDNPVQAPLPDGPFQRLRGDVAGEDAPGVHGVVRLRMEPLRLAPPLGGQNVLPHLVLEEADKSLPLLRDKLRAAICRKFDCPGLDFYLCHCFVLLFI